MIIIFNGTTLDLLNRLEQFSGKSQKVTLDFMLENFRIPSEKEENDAAGMATMRQGGTAMGYIR